MRRVILLVWLLDCGDGGSGSGSVGGAGGGGAPGTGGASAGAGQGGAAATGGSAGGSGADTGGAPGGTGGSAAGGTGGSGMGGAGQTGGAGGQATGGAGGAGGAAEVLPPFMCAGMPLPTSGMRPAACVHPAIASQCLSRSPATVTPAPCDLGNPQLYLSMCILSTFRCQVDDQCCGATYPGPLQGACKRETPSDIYGRCR